LQGSASFTRELYPPRWQWSEVVRVELATL
jgi:hypothetical protein